MVTNTQRAAAVLFAAVMAIAAISGGGMATVPSIDTSATDATTTTSEIVDDADFQNVSGLNSNVTYIAQVNVTADDTVEMKVQVNGSDTIVHRNTSGDNVSVAGTGNSGAHYNLSFVGTDIDDMERTLNENVTVDVTVYDADNESAPGDAASAGNGTTETIFLNFSDDRVVENLDDVDADPDTNDAPVETRDDEDTLTTLSSITPLDSSTVDTDDLAINGEDSEVVLVFSNDTVADDAAAAFASDAEDGDPIFGFTLLATGDETTRLIRVYNEEPPDSIDDDDDGDTYGVYKDGGIGGEDGIEIHLGGAFEDDDEVAVTGVLNDALVNRVVHRASTSPFLGEPIGLEDGAVLGFVPLLFIGAPVARRRSVEEAVVIETESHGEATGKTGSEA